MVGKVKWFNAQRGYGFIIDSEGNDEFVHQSNIIMKGFRHLDEDDIVSFELGTGHDGRKQATKVNPLCTRQMISDALKEDDLHVTTIKDAYGVTKYLVVDRNNAIKTSEEGMDFMKLSAYAGFSIVYE